VKNGRAMKNTNKFILTSCALLFCAHSNASEVEVPTTFVSGTVAKASEINGNFKALADGINDNNAKADANALAIAENKASIQSSSSGQPILQLYVKDYGLVGNVIGGSGIATIIDAGNEIILIQSGRPFLGSIIYTDAECLNPVVTVTYGLYRGLGKTVIVSFDAESTNLYAVDADSTLTESATYYAAGNRTNEDGTITRVCNEDFNTNSTYSVKTVPRPAYFDKVVGGRPSFASEVEFRFAGM
jgi:hypothetical protein